MDGWACPCASIGAVFCQLYTLHAKSGASARRGREEGKGRGKKGRQGGIVHGRGEELEHTSYQQKYEKQEADVGRGEGR
jgi:hypothetical protein